MNPEILKLMNPKTTRLDGAGGGIPLLTTDDINAACAGADSIGLDMLLAKICADRQAQSRAFYSLYQEIVQLSVERRWKIREKGEEKIRSLTQLIIYELTNAPRCPKCKGTKFNRNLKPCKSCEGTGFYRIKDTQRAKAMKISPSTWQRVWSYRYADVLGVVATHEADALRRIGKKLKHDLS